MIGKWFDGTEFVSATFYSENGILTKTRPAQVDFIFDLQGKYVIPPYAEAHTHTLIHGDRISEFLQDGIFYAKVMNATKSQRDRGLPQFNKPTSVDVRVLKMLCEITPQAIFPDRLIGRLQEGYEASLVVLQGNPIKDFQNIRRIELRIKQGQVVGAN